jgi:hypothetical protein
MARPATTAADATVEARSTSPLGSRSANAAGPAAVTAPLAIPLATRPAISQPNAPEVAKQATLRIAKPSAGTRTARRPKRSDAWPATANVAATVTT